MKSNLLSYTVRLGITLLAVIHLCSAVKAASPSEYDDVEVLRSDEQGVLFRYVVPELERSTTEILERSFDLLNIDKCGLSNLPGRPQIPVRRVLIAIPPEAQFSVEVVDREEAELSGIDLAYALEVRPDETSPVGYRPIPIRPTPVEDEYYPSEIVSFDSPTLLRNQRILQLELFPLQYNRVRKTARHHSEITVKVSFWGGREGAPSPQKDLFERIYRNVLLNYEQSRGWRKTREEKGLLKPAITYPFGYSDNWYKITVWENGIYKIHRNALIGAGLPVGSLDPRTLRMFSGGGKVLPLDNSNPLLELREMAIFVSGEEDGSFDADDFILFFGWSTNDWEHDFTGAITDFHTNPFTNENVFWLTFDPSPSFPDPPKRMDFQDGSLSDPNPLIPQKFRSRTHMEQDNTLRTLSTGSLVDYFHWYWMEAPSIRMFVNLPGGLPQDTFLVKVRYAGSTPRIMVNGQEAETLDSLSFGDVKTARSLNFRGGLVDTLDIESGGFTFLDWYEIEYPRRLECHDRKLLFESPEYSGAVQFDISNLFSSQVHLFEVTDYFEVKRFGGFQIEGEFVRFQDTMVTDLKKRYFLVDETRIKEPSRILRDENSDLREFFNQADFLIITHSDFYDQVLSLKSFRESFNQMSVRVVKVQDVYDEFSGGLLDPVAIRDFLKYAYKNWAEPAPAFAMLVGDGNYDYKNNGGQGGVNYIPPFAPTWEGDRSVSDENYVYFGRYGYLDSDSAGVPQARKLDMVISRWPVRTKGELEEVIGKVIDYEESPQYGPWRNLITLVADDEFTDDSDAEAIHTRDTEKLAKFHVPPGFNLSKIYLMEYPFDFKDDKPEAEEAIVKAFNSGTLIINYMGHGNPNVWSHENVFQRSQDIPRLTNKRKLPLIYTASCSIGLFFNPVGEGMAEQLLREEGKGAIATISATWLVFPEPNAALNFAVYDLLLNQDSLSIGEALFIAKLWRQPNSNDRQFVLFGDPVLKLGAPRLRAEVTEVSPDTLSALSLITVAGEVKNGAGQLMASFDGIAKILAFDSQRARIHTMPGGGQVRYALPGPIMFRGDAEVKQGKFQASFVVPKDISYGGNTGRISVYLAGQDNDGAGVRDSLVIRGSDTTVIDTTGPEISLTFDDRLSFTGGEVILPNSVLNLSLYDEYGINTTGEVGHGITLVIDQDFQNQIDLTESFEYDLGSYRQGSLSYQLPGLYEGDHVLDIKSWDNANNSSVLRANVHVSAQRELELTQVMNYPNPFSTVTNFYYHLSQNAERVEIKIFTLAGKLIRHLPFSSSRAGTNYSAIWDGRDQDGDEVANGVYIYKIIAEGTVNGEQKKKEALGKAVVVR
jgi:hypothetical protein